jgi:hypothetical protein
MAISDLQNIPPDSDKYTIKNQHHHNVKVIREHQAGTVAITRRFVTWTGREELW